MYFIIRIFQAFTWMVSFPSQIHLFGIRGNFKHIFHHNLHTYNRTVLILCYFPLPTITESPNFASDERTPAPLDSHAPKSCHSHIRHCCRYIHISTVWVRYRKTANSIIQMCLCKYNWNYCSWAKKKRRHNGWDNTNCYSCFTCFLSATDIFHILLSRKSAVVSVDVVGNAVSGWIHCTCESLDITLLYNTPLHSDYADK